jgi:O-antigen/teichoic acid export membrane protein
MPLANVVGLLALLAIHHFTPVSAGSVYVFCSTPFAFWVFIKLWRDCRPTLLRFRDSTKALLSYGVRSYGIDLCGTLSLYVDQALVVGLLSARAMGTYVVALSLSRMLNMCHTSVVSVLFPKSVGRSVSEIIRMTGSAARLSTSLTALAGIIVCVFGPFILRLLYGPAYSVATDILRILTMEVVIGGLVSVLSQAPMALGRPGVVTLLQTLGLALTVPLMMVFVPKYGLIGAGYALLISTTCRLLFIVISFPLFLKVSCPRLLLTRLDLESVLIRITSFARRLRASQVGDYQATTIG